MTLTELLLSQLTDPFRLGMLVFLVLTAARTRSVNGILVPLIAGALFIAVIIPMLLTPAGADTVRQIACGAALNGALLALFYAGKSVLLRK
jgi:hypothetical protein